MDTEQPEAKTQALLFRIKSELQRAVPPEYEGLGNKELSFINLETVYAGQIAPVVCEDIPRDCFEKKEDHYGFSFVTPLVNETAEFLRQNPKKISELGKLLQEKLKDGRIVDFAAGDPKLPVVERWAQIFGAKEYIGVDRWPFFEETAKEEGDFYNFHIKGDALVTAAKFPDSSADVIHVSGLEHEKEYVAGTHQKYFDAFIKELRRILKPAGIVMTGPGCDVWLRYNELFTNNAFDRKLIAVKKSAKRELDRTLKSAPGREQELDIARVLYTGGYAVYQKTQEI